MLDVGLRLRGAGCAAEVSTAVMVAVLVMLPGSLIASARKRTVKVNPPPGASGSHGARFVVQVRTPVVWPLGVTSQPVGVSFVASYTSARLAAVRLTLPVLVMRRA